MADDGRPYAVRLTGAGRRALQRLPEGVAASVIELVFGPLADQQHRVGKPLGLELEGLHSARRGDYRVLYSIDDQRREIAVQHIAHRSDVCRRR